MICHVLLIKRAKEESGKKYIEFSREDLLQVKRNSALALAINSDVSNGMRNFRIVVQPVVSTEEEKIIGGEVLLRWQYEDRDVPLNIFISLLEKNNMISTVGRWVFEETVKICKRFLEVQPDLYLSFNVSLHQLADAGFLSFIKKTLKQYSLEGKYLTAELTETCIDEHPKELHKFIRQCQALGMRIALDDFGSGYSSLRMLLKYPTSIVKLDRSLLSEIPFSDSKSSFIGSIVYACHQFDKTVCMEGVETKTQLEMIREAQCDMIQGFYYHRPQEVDDVYNLLTKEADCK